MRKRNGHRKLVNKCYYSTIISQTSTTVIVTTGFQLTLGRAWKLVRKTLTHAYNNLGDNYKHGYGDYEDGQEWITPLECLARACPSQGKTQVYQSQHQMWAKKED